MPVFPIDRFPDASGRFELSSEQVHHLCRVLRIKAGENFDVSLPDGIRGKARLEKSAATWSGIWLKESAQPAWPSLPAWVGIGTLKMSRLEWLVEKAAELGAERISLLQLQHGSIAKTETISTNKIERLRKIIQETLKQCERNTFTQIEAPQSLAKFLEQVKSEANRAQKIILRERFEAPVLSKILEPKARLKVFLIGPEGGFSEAELRLAEAAGFQAASLGPLLLRSETAALAALSCFQLHVADEGKPA